MWGTKQTAYQPLLTAQRNNKAMFATFCLWLHPVPPTKGYQRSWAIPSIGNEAWADGRSQSLQLLTQCQSLRGAGARADVQPHHWQRAESSCTQTVNLSPSLDWIYFSNNNFSNTSPERHHSLETKVKLCPMNFLAKTCLKHEAF